MKHSPPNPLGKRIHEQWIHDFTATWGRLPTWQIPGVLWHIENVLRALRSGSRRITRRGERQLLRAIRSRLQKRLP